MKVGIEAQRIFRNNKHGMDVVALETMRQLQLLDTSNEFVLFARKGPDSNCISTTANFHHHIVRGLTYADWEQFGLPAALRGSKQDLVHCTSNTAPLRCPVPLVLTLHDIIYLEDAVFGGSTYQNLGNLYRKFVVPRVIKTARKIITVSDFEKKVIVKRFPWVEEKINVVHNGVGSRFQRIKDQDELGAFRKKYRLPANFILFLGNTAPKKNTVSLIKAYVHYCDIESDPVPIVVTDYGKERVRWILEELNKPELINRFILPGYIPSVQMPLLYSCSSLFIYPSLRESFGLPVLEAMGCGVPVITSNNSALPEIAGDAAMLIDPLDIEQLGEAMQEVLTDEMYSGDLIRKGLHRVERFSWQNAAEKLLAIYRSV